LFELLDDLSARIKVIEGLLEKSAVGDRQVELLLTHKGIGLLSALVVVHTLGDVSRFPSSKEAVAYTGLDPLERSSAGRVKFGAISKAGSSVLRHLLGQAMHVAARYDPELKAFYKRLASRRSKSIAKTAAGAKTLNQTVHHAERWNRLCRVQKARLGSWNARTVSWSAMTVF
jgi:transposase